MSDRRKVLELFEKQKDITKALTDAGIERYRKGNAYITLKDEEGNPIKNVKIKVNQKNHEFKFGANIFMLDELETEEKNAKYKELFADVFNVATVPFYWDGLEPEQGKPRYEKTSPKVYRRPSPDLCVEFCKEHGIEPREHALAYEGFFPKWLYDKSVHEIKTALEKRFKEVAERYSDSIPTIEVTNELEWAKGRTAIYDDPDYMEWCFKTAEKYFPKNKLVPNEISRLCWADRCRVTDKYYAYLEANILKGCRFDSIGMQFHMFGKRDAEYEYTRPYYDPENLMKHMDLYARFGKPLQVTEITIPAYSNDAEDESIQAEIIEHLYPIWFSHPNMEQIVYWNAIDGYAHLWDPSPEKIKASQGDMTLGENVYYGGLLRFDMTPKPAYNAIKNLLQNVWHTEEEIVTDENGEAIFRGFYGKYDVTYTIDGKEITKTIDLSKEKYNKFTI